MPAVILTSDEVAAAIVEYAHKHQRLPPGAVVESVVIRQDTFLRQDHFCVHHGRIGYRLSSEKSAKRPGQGETGGAP